MAKKKKSSNSISVNFGKVDKEIRKHTEKSARVPEGDYLVKILGGKLKENEDSDANGINWRTQIVKPVKYKGKLLYGYTHLGRESLWNLRNLIHAVTGKNVAGKKAVDVDLDGYNGKIVGAVVEDNEYKDKVYSRINTWFPKDEYEESDDDDEDDEDLDDDDDEDEDDEDEEDLDEVDDDDL